MTAAENPETAWNSCQICRKQKGDEPPPGAPIYSDELIYVCHANLDPATEDQYLGWIVIETRRHTPDLASLTKAEACRVGEMARQLARAQEFELEAQNVYAFIIGEGVSHFHMHLIPRYPDTPREYWGTRIDEWPEAPRGGEAVISALNGDLRRRLDTFS